MSGSINPGDTAHRNQAEATRLGFASEKLPKSVQRKADETQAAWRKRVLAYLRRGLPEDARKGMEEAEARRGW